MAEIVLKEITGCLGTPEPRSGHRCCATANHLLVYGGYNRHLDHKMFSEILCYNMTSKQWTEVPNSRDFRTESASCSMVLNEGALIIFGGSGYPFGYTSTNRTSLFSLSKLMWLDLDQGCSSPDTPVARYGQSMVLSKRDEWQRIYVLSGTIGEIFLDDIHYFDLLKRTWHQVKNISCPDARYRHEVVSDDDYFYLFGGSIHGYSMFGFEEIQRFSFDQHKWTKLACQPAENGLYPAPRKSHSCVLQNRDVYMCGGLSDFNVYCDDIWKVNLDDCVWRKLAVVMTLFNFNFNMQQNCIMS